MKSWHLIALAFAIGLTSCNAPEKDISNVAIRVGEKPVGRITKEIRTSGGFYIVDGQIVYDIKQGTNYTLEVENRWGSGEIRGDKIPEVYRGIGLFDNFPKSREGIVNVKEKK